MYCAAVMDAWSRRIIGWSIGEQQTTDLVLDALGMAILRRNPTAGSTILHSDHGTQYTSWAFGKRLRDAGLLGSMGSIGDCYDNSMMESFWGSMQLELLDRRAWKTRNELANAIFEWIECWYNPKRRHSSIGMLSPTTCPENGAKLNKLLFRDTPANHTTVTQYVTEQPRAYPRVGFCSPVADRRRAERAATGAPYPCPVPLLTSLPSRCHRFWDG